MPQRQFLAFPNRRPRAAGNVRELTGYRTAASIPSKFETVLHTGNKERNGFNTRVYRFNDSEARAQRVLFTECRDFVLTLAFALVWL